MGVEEDAYTNGHNILRAYLVRGLQPDPESDPELAAVVAKANELVSYHANLSSGSISHQELLALPAYQVCLDCLDSFDWSRLGNTLFPPELSLD